MKIAIYTAITGNKDTLKETQFENNDYICFTDSDLKSNVWTIKPACSLFSDPNRNAKIHKVLAHQYLEDYDYSLWMDANIYLQVSIEELIKKYLACSDIALFEHFEKRNCIYKEADVCIRHRLDDIDTIQKQMSVYKHNGYPADNGLFECTVILRRHTKKIEKLNNYWWAEICRHSKRDQLSFNYTIHNIGIKPAQIEGHIKNNIYFKRIAHDGHTIKSKGAIEVKKTFREVEGNIKVLICKPTLWQGCSLGIGDTIDLPNRVAMRWVKFGIAQYHDVKSFLKREKPTKYKFTRHPKVSIIVLVRNELDYIKKCFDSVYEYSADYELIVVDNGAGAEVKEYLHSLKNFDLTIITNKENQGFPYGCNQGVKVAKHEYVCFLNSDTIVTPYWLDKLMLVFKNKKDCGVSGPSTSYCGGNQCIKSLMGIRHKMSQQDINTVAEKLSEGQIILSDLMGFCFVAKKKLFDIAGGFDYRRFKLGCTEEREWLWRAQKLGKIKTYWIKDAYVHHFGHVVFNELGINVATYNKEKRQEWERIKDKITPEFIKNDVRITKIERINIE